MIPERGDILHLQFDTASGNVENPLCLVVSPRSFNARFRLSMVCPISGGAAEAARSSGFLISLILEKADVHEKHEKTRTNSNVCQDFLCHPLGGLKNLCN